MPCFASWLHERLLSGTHKVSLPVSLTHLHGRENVVGSYGASDFNLVSECQPEKKVGGREMHVYREKRKLVKRALITICSSVGCSHEVRQSFHYI